MCSPNLVIFIPSFYPKGNARAEVSAFVSFPSGRLNFIAIIMMIFIITTTQEVSRRVVPI